jgi:hypothetical protein
VRGQHQPHTAGPPRNAQDHPPHTQRQKHAHTLTHPCPPIAQISALCIAQNDKFFRVLQQSHSFSEALTKLRGESAALACAADVNRWCFTSELSRALHFICDHGPQFATCAFNQCAWPPWPNGQGVGLLIRRLRVRVPQGVSCHHTGIKCGGQRNFAHIRRFPMHA